MRPRLLITMLENHDKITKYKMAALASMIRSGVYEIGEEQENLITDYDPLGGP